MFTWIKKIFQRPLLLRKEWIVENKTTNKN